MAGPGLAAAGRVTASRTRIVWGAVGIVLLGATLFGLWHLVVGGFINGNPRAGTFGLVLALAAGLPLVAALWVARRRGRRSLAA